MKVVIADGHPTMRLGLRGLLFTTEMRVVGETGDGEEAIRLARERHPDLVVLGLNLTGETDGIEACRRIKALPHPPRVLVYAAHDFADPVSACLLAGADCCLNKRVECEEFLDIMRRVVAGERSWLPGPARSGGRARCWVPHESPPGAALLTSKEREVLVLLLRRCSNAEIADRLYLSVPTVKTHLRNILRKLGAKSRRDLLHPDAVAASNF
jgi:DNA-binding NarL/FixJ family response regulator